jgi:hypothetical protein
MTDTIASPIATLNDVHKFFKGADASYTLKAFRDDWANLSDETKNQLKVGIGNGTYTY